MTKRLSFSLDLNVNDLDALQTVLANPRAVATAVEPNDPWEHARIVDVLVEMAGSVAAAMKPAVEAESSD
ncbi:MULTISPECIES: hypothetical protein [Pseudomonas syringae group]|uniref:Uncharacterized protein n=1 Tax=Pseudomonas asturiensis TaxID=1190415 RepID=A0ABX6HFH5_9PSED|nr:hypothetical protein [Pseudomonas asturiensis]MEE4127572.1 hypothetical protein [Pseudomonas viridiflava]QHF04327.1 hypothetical protein N015_18705 [Pseudomonas asturiensis]